MPQLNANIPYIRCFVRDTFLQGLDGRRSLTPCYIFGVKAQLNRPLGFHCQLQNGALFWNLPISAFVHREKFACMSRSEPERLSLLQYWDCQGSDIAVTVFSYLQGYQVDCRARNKIWMRGTYLFTLDQYFSDLNAPPLGYAGDPDAKCYHVIRLDNGNFCAYPNTFLRWHNLNFVDPYDLKKPPRYRANQQDLKAEWIP
jgi:hypothetical protein